MRKKLYYFLCLVFSVLCFAQITSVTSFASTYSTPGQGQVNVGITFKKDDDSKEKKDGTHKPKDDINSNGIGQEKGFLPRTGEVMRHYIGFIGLMLLILSLQLANKRKQK